MKTGNTHIDSEDMKKGTKGTLQAELQQSFRTYIKCTSFLKEQNLDKCTNTDIKLVF